MRPAVAIACLILLAGAARATERIFFVGDSLTANVVLPPNQTLPSRVCGWLGQAALCQNLASPGATMAPYGFYGGYASLDGLFNVIGGVDPPVATVVMLGTNDYKRSVPLEKFRAAYQAFIARAPRSVHIVCVTPPWRAEEPAPNSAGATMDDYRNVIRKVCANATVVEGADAVPHDPSYYAVQPHLNANGNLLLSRAIARALRPMVLAHQPNAP